MPGDDAGAVQRPSPTAQQQRGKARWTHAGDGEANGGDRLPYSARPGGQIVRLRRRVEGERGARSRSRPADHAKDRNR